MAVIALLLALVGLGQADGAPPLTAAPVATARVIATYPHDRGAYTEGLFIHDGQLFESTGEVGASGIRRVDLKTGKVLQRVALAPPYYGEGIAPWRDQILSLTWRDGVGFRWSRTGLKRIGRFRYVGEGWALTSNGTDLIMSDGSPVLRFVDPATFKVKRTLTVVDGGRPVAMLNELEFVEGEVLANVWLTDRIARIDPTDGHVIGWIDLTAVHRQAGYGGSNDVLNGIAWDAKARKLYVTGKRWPKLFEIAPPKG